MSNNSNVQTTIASIYEERDRLLASGDDFEPGMIAGKIDNLTSLAKDLIRQGKWTIGAGTIPVSTVEQILSELRYDLMNWRSIVGLFLPDSVSLVTNDSRVIISLGKQVISERPVFVILGRGDDDSYNLLDLETAEILKVNGVQVAARVIATGVEYL